MTTWKSSRIDFPSWCLDILGYPQDPLLFVCRDKQQSTESGNSHLADNWGGPVITAAEV